MGERAAPPYIGRGLMEAIFSADIVANDDPDDRRSHCSTLDNIARPTDCDPNNPPRVTLNPECPGDCISGRHNENSPGAAFPTLDPVIRVSRFGLRAAGPSLIQFMLGGTQQEIGLTSPFAPTENNNNQNVGRTCDVAPDPEITEQDIFNLVSLLEVTGESSRSPVTWT